MSGLACCILAFACLGFAGDLVVDRGRKFPVGLDGAVSAACVGALVGLWVWAVASS